MTTIKVGLFFRNLLDDLFGTNPTLVMHLSFLMKHPEKLAKK